MAHPHHPRTRIRGATLACVLAGVFAGAAAGPAHAADVTVDGGALRIVDATGENNTLSVSATPLGYDVYDERSALKPGAGCVAVEPLHVACQAMVAKIWIEAGAGDDFVMVGDITIPVYATGGAGDDLVEGGQGGDLLGGGSGNDNVIGSGGDDGLVGEDGADVLQGGQGGDKMAGGDGADVLEDDGAGGDRMRGEGGRDLLKGGRGDDTLDGGSGADVLITGSGADTAEPGSGNDRVFASAGDSIDCKGAGADKVSSPGAPPSGCRNLSDDAVEPKIWPPPPETRAASTGPTATDLIARAARNAPPQPSGSYQAQVLRRGEARRIGFQIAYGFRMTVRVRVRTYRRDDSLIHEHYERVSTRQPDWVAIEGPARDVWSARLRCCF